MLRSHGIACDSKSGIGSYTIRQVPVMEQCLVFCLLWKFYIIDCLSNTCNLSGVFSKGFYQNKRLDPIHVKLTQPISKVASCSVSIGEFCDFTNCWLTDIVISRPTNQPQNSFHDALSSEKKYRSCLVRH